MATTRSSAVFRSLREYIEPEPVVVVISGPSGVGKDSVIRRMQELRHSFHFVVTATDREPRPGEVPGVDYLFVTTDEFEHMIDGGDLFEYANVYGQYKGVPRRNAEQALASGTDVVMRLDVQGAATVRREIPDAVTIFLVPPTLEVLDARLRRRPGDTAEQTAQRREAAIEELARAPEFDYVVVNREGELDATIQTIVSIITAAKCATRRRSLADDQGGQPAPVAW